MKKFLCLVSAILLLTLCACSGSTGTPMRTAVTSTERQFALP